MRRMFVSLMCGLVAASCIRPAAADEPETQREAAIAATGEEVAALASYDRMMARLLRQWKIPGGSIAVTKDGRLVFARGYGLADVEQKRPVEPESLFRVASVSKPLTAIAVLRLAETGKLDLDEKAIAALGPLEGPPGSTVDPRLGEITLRMLLQHTAGWDRDKSFDAMFIPGRAAKAMGAPEPADARTVIGFMLGQKLDFDPGQRFAYSNLGYAIAGRMIERRTGLSYGEAVAQLVLQPAGVTRMRLGRTLAAFRAAGEVSYYNYDEKDLTECVFPYVKDKVAWPDGGFHLEAMDAHGGWIASTIDLVRIVAAVEGRGRTPLLKAESIETMLALPPFQRDTKPPSHYGLGWNVRADGKDANWWHTGSLPGTSALLVRAHNGLCWAVLVNSRPEDSGKFHRAVDAACWEAADEVKEWPTHNLFEKYK